jgi:glycerol-3-phosphate dehydrogenase
VIERSPARAAECDHDLVIVGGGIHGAALLLEAGRRGLRACLCEAGDFGSGTSGNSLRILHGGLRYLQTLDLRRFQQSVSARRGFALDFPELVRPLSCLLPLYGHGLNRPAVLRLALHLNDALSAGRNRRVGEELWIAPSSVLDVEQTVRLFPAVRRDGLVGGACWSDYFMRSSERVLMEMLRWAARLGGIALNRARVESVQQERGRVSGVEISDVRSGERFLLRARAVANCAGPAVDDLAGAERGRELFRPSLAFNLLLDARLPAHAAVGVAAPAPGSPVLFLIPQEGSVLAGTRHLPRPTSARSAEPTPAEIDQFLELVRAAVPGFEVHRGCVRRVFAGLLPARTEGSAELSKRERVHDHGRSGGPHGFVSVAGVKFTTARAVAEDVLDRLGLRGRKRAAGSGRGPLSPATGLLIDASRLWVDPPESLRDALRCTLREESVTCLDDLVLRRSNWATTEVDLDRVRQRVSELLADGPTEMLRTGT